MATITANPKYNQSFIENELVLLTVELTLNIDETIKILLKTTEQENTVFVDDSTKILPFCNINFSGF